MIIMLITEYLSTLFPNDLRNRLKTFKPEIHLLSKSKSTLKWQSSLQPYPSQAWKPFNASTTVMFFINIRQQILEPKIK